MNYYLWLYYDMNLFNRCSQLLWIYLLMAATINLAMSSQLHHPYISQGISTITLSSNAINSDFCARNWKALLNSNDHRPQILSSKNGPSSTNHNLSSSRDTTSLPQGSILNFTDSPHFRIDSNTFMPFFPMAGCISLQNYYWRFNLSSNEEQSSFGIKIFIFHIYNNIERFANVINLRILLDSTQEASHQRPVAIVLSSFLPRRFYLSVLSYLSHTQQPIHIILTNFNSDVIIIDRDLNDSDMARIFISVLDSSYNYLFQLKSPTNDDANLKQIRDQIMTTNFLKFGFFTGFRYTDISRFRRVGMLWLFDNEQKYSTRRPDIKLVAIYLVYNKSNSIDLVLDRQEDPINVHNAVFYQDQCVIVKDDNYHSLVDRISTFDKLNFYLDEHRTCTYQIKPTPSSSSTSNARKYKSVTWLHFETTTNVTIHIKLSSNRLFHNDDRHLVILTAESMKWSTINIESFFLHKKVQILSNISLDQFNQQRQEGSSFLTSIESINGTPTGTGLTQQQIITNYIIASSSAVMQTTIYKLKLTETYEIRVNIDDSQIHAYATVLVSPSCWCDADNHIAPTLSIDLRLWKQVNNWMPTQFQYGNSGRTFNRLNDTFITLDTELKDCSMKSSKIYGIWRNKKYLLYLPFEYRCVKFNKIKFKTEAVSAETTVAPMHNFIAISEQGFNVFNDSKFKTLLKRKQFHDKDRLFVELTQHVAWRVSLNEGIDLGDCYITDRAASANDLKYSNQSQYNVQKLIIIRGGCINQTSSLYSNIDQAMRPKLHFMVNNILYRFSFGIDADKWASELSLQHHWLYRNRIEVHLYCGIKRCYRDKSLISNPLHNVDDCQPQHQCTKPLLAAEQIYKYFGPLIITKEDNTAMKISVLVAFILIIGLLLLLLVLFLKRLHTLRSRYKYNRSVASTTTAHWRPLSCPNVTATTTNDIVTATNIAAPIFDHSAVRLLLLPDDAITRHSSVLPLLVLQSDKSLILHATYLSPPNNSDQSDLGRVHSSRHFMSQSVSDLVTDPGHDRPLYSWPLSSFDRYRRSSYPRPPLPSTQVLLSSNCLTLFNKVSLTFNSNQKLSSNRTTMSGGGGGGGTESASGTDMLTNKPLKWWSPLSNCSLRKTFVMSRN